MAIIICFPHQKLKLSSGHLKRKLKRKKGTVFYLHQPLAKTEEMQEARKKLIMSKNGSQQNQGKL